MLMIELKALPWGNGFNTTGGDVVAFNNLKGPTSWSSTVQNSTGALASSSFALGEWNVPFQRSIDETDD